MGCYRSLKHHIRPRLSHLQKTSLPARTASPPRAETTSCQLWHTLSSSPLDIQAAPPLNLMVQFQPSAIMCNKVQRLHQGCLKNVICQSGKCSHGGILDKNTVLRAKGGINKDSTSPVFSPHHYLHKEAATLATEATQAVLRDLKDTVGDEALLRWVLSAISTVNGKLSVDHGTHKTFFPNILGQALQREAEACIGVCFGHHRQHVWGDHRRPPQSSLHHPEQNQQRRPDQHLCACALPWPRYQLQEPTNPHPPTF